MIDFSFLKRGDIIGHGASSRVYKYCYLKKDVAMKILSPELTDEVLDAFVHEANLMLTFDHRNIVKFYGICVRPPQIGLVVELCSQGDLKGHLKTKSHYWSPPRKLRACLECAAALAYLHSHNIIHRDVKCHNFFVDNNYTVKLGDFGESSVKDPVRNMTILGTVGYMSPELIAGDKHYTTAIDIYALAVTVNEIWVGEEPFCDITNFLKIYDLVLNGTRPTLTSDAPPTVIRLIQVRTNRDIVLSTGMCFNYFFPF